MTATDFIEPLVGSWSGVNLLRLMPTDNYTESAATASVRVVAGTYACIEYTWFDGDAPQSGILLISSVENELTAVWADSWHSSPTWLSMTGTVEGSRLVLTGHYPAPPGPDWGWQIHIEQQPRRLTMHNLVPGEDAYQVVELTLETSA